MSLAIHLSINGFSSCLLNETAGTDAIHFSIYKGNISIYAFNVNNDDEDKPTRYFLRASLDISDEVELQFSESNDASFIGKATDIPAKNVDLRGLCFFIQMDGEDLSALRIKENSSVEIGIIRVDLMRFTLNTTYMDEDGKNVTRFDCSLHNGNRIRFGLREHIP